jgi:FecR-like protein
MKRLLVNIASILSLVLASLTLANAAQLREARVTQVVSDVKLLPQQAPPRPASLNDPVRNGTAVRTGAKSRSELTFPDLTITRLGANTIFSFEEGTRTMDLRDGAILFQVPKGSGGATIRTSAVTAAITGTTGIAEYHPATATRPRPFSKWLCLEGTFHLTLPNGQSVEIGPGKMVTTSGENFSQVMSFNIGQVMKTSLLVLGYDTPLASLALIQIEQDRQLGLLIARTPITNTSTLFDPANIIDVVDQGITAQESPTVTPTPPITPTPSTPTPTPSKFGTPTVIASSDPYIIDSNTVIRTDPTITRNGVTDFGKIWRGPAQDGPLSAFIFGATSAFDIASGFDSELNGDISGAGFKFSSLQLTGDPTISTANGEINLGLIAINGITSGGPGGVLNFAGIRGLLLATQNGPINLGPEISFSGGDITFYARGAGSMLTLGSDVSTVNKIRLYAEGDIQLSSDLSTQHLIVFGGGDFDFTAGSIDAQDILINVGGDFDFSAGSIDAQDILINVDGNFNSTVGSPLVFNIDRFLLAVDGAIHIDDSLEVVADEANQTGLLTGGLNVVLRAGKNLNIDGDLSLTTNINDVSNGGNLHVESGADATIGGALTLLVDNSDAGQIGGGGNIEFITGGDLDAASIDALVNNRNGGAIASGGNLTFDIGGALTTSGDASFVTSNRNDGGGGGTISSNVAVTLNVASASVGTLTTSISTNAGGAITGNALNSVAFDGALMAIGFVDIAVQNTGFNVFGGPFIAGGTIGEEAAIALTASSIATGDILDVEIDNNGAGHIGGDAIIDVAVSNNITTSSNVAVQGVGDAFFDIVNTAELREDTLIDGGTIDGDATVNFSAGNVTTQGLFEVGVLNNDQRFLNGGGHIGGDAEIVFSAANVSSTNYFNLVINNAQGSIGGGSTIDANAASISTGNTFFAHIFNDGGEIGSGASVSVLTAGAIAAAASGTFEIVNDAGSIGGDAMIDLHATNVSAETGDVFMRISNHDSGRIEGNASLDVRLSGNITARGNGVFDLSNGSGAILSSASITVTANNITTTNGFLQLNLENTNGSMRAATVALAVAGNINTGDFLETQIFNQNAQMLGDASILVGIDGGVDVGADAFFGVANTNGTIDSDAIINVGAANLSTVGFIQALIDNAPGSIGGEANIRIGAESLVADSLFTRIDNSGGSIGGSATINMNVSGSSTVTTDASVEILGSDGAESAAINVTNGNYEVGGTFRTFIDGSGTIAFNNASVHADVLKVGVFGDNGVLNIGGGSLSADTTLKLYASGGNGQLNFISDVTLGGDSAKILAANSITIVDDVVVTIGGETAADVFTNNANYSESSGGNDSTTGTFAGAGANSPQPLDDAPPFDDVRAAPSPAAASKPKSPRRPPATPALIHSRPRSLTHLTSANRHHGDASIAARKPTRPGIRVSDSGQLLSLLDRTADAGGKIAVPAPNNARNNGSTSRGSDAGRVSATPRAATSANASLYPAKRLP